MNVSIRELVLGKDDYFRFEHIELKVFLTYQGIVIYRKLKMQIWVLIVNLM